jgi:hypothetical protein
MAMLVEFSPTVAWFDMIGIVSAGIDAGIIAWDGG